VGGVAKTFSNRCVAESEHAKHIVPGKCEDQSNTQVRFCPEIYLPVCATKDGKQETYSNSCFALAAGATINNSGKCSTAKWKLRALPLAGDYFGSTLLVEFVPAFGLNFGLFPRTVATW
jgi:hypothetical protein